MADDLVTKACTHISCSVTILEHSRRHNEEKLCFRASFAVLKLDGWLRQATAATEP